MSEPSLAPAAHTSEELREQLELLARLRLAKAMRLEQVSRALRAFEAQHAALYDDLRALTNGVAEVEQHVRADAVALYRLDLNRRLVPGLSIRLETTVTVTDAAAALAWALEKRMAVRLDAKQLEGVVKAGVPVPGVHAETGPHATIAQDLLTFYPGANRDQPPAEPGPPPGPHAADGAATGEEDAGV